CRTALPFPSSFPSVRSSPPWERIRRRRTDPEQQKGNCQANEGKSRQDVPIRWWSGNRPRAAGDKRAGIHRMTGGSCRTIRVAVGIQGVRLHTASSPSKRDELLHLFLVCHTSEFWRG